MNVRLFRLLESLARIDASLRREQRRPVPDAALLRDLSLLKLRAKALMTRRLLRPAQV